MTPEQADKNNNCYHPGANIIEAAVAKFEANPEQYPFDDIDGAVSLLQDISFHGFYSEPGYDLKEGQRGIMLGNANNPFRPDDKKFPYGSKERDELMAKVKKQSLFSRTFKALDRVGYEFEWRDEWQTCDECRGLVRTSPDCYGWQKAFYTTDDDSCICSECVKSDDSKTTEYLEWLEGNSKRADMFNLDLSKLGYTLLKDDFEHGFHHGQDADPNKIGAALNKAGVKRFIFEMDSVGQFDFKFSVYVHDSEIGLINADQLTPAVCDGPSVSQAMQRGLQQASVVSAALPAGPGVRYTKITGDTAKATLIPPEEFVEHGTKLAEQRMDAAT